MKIILPFMIYRWYELQTFQIRMSTIQVHHRACCRGRPHCDSKLFRKSACGCNTVVI